MANTGKHPMTSTLDDAREEISRIIYEAFPFDDAGQKPEWTPGGNSLRQDEARDAADKIIAFRAAPARSDAVNARAAVIEECAKIAENNGWEATAAQIRDLMASSADRACTCHPDEAPVPCQKKYAFSECKAAALSSTHRGSPSE